MTIKDIHQVKIAGYKKETVEALEAMLKLAKSGKLIAITVVEEFNDRTYRITGTSTESRSVTGAWLIEAGMLRLGFHHTRSKT